MSDELDSFGDSIFNGYLPSLWRKLCPDTQKPLGTMLHYLVVHHHASIVTLIFRLLFDLCYLHK